MADNGKPPLDLGGILSEIVPPKLDILGEAENSPPSALRSPLKKDLFAEKERKAWVHNDGARCDFTSRPALGYRTGLFFLAVWRRSLYGKTLVEIKADDAMIGRVATATADLLAEVLGSNLSLGSWAVITTPKRRHLQRNFATLVSIAIAHHLGLPFYEDCASCHSKQRKPREPKSVAQPTASAEAPATTAQPQAEAAAAEQPKLLVYKRSRNGGFYVYLLGVMPEDNIGCNCRSAKKAIRYMLWKKRELGASISEKHFTELRQLAAAEG